MTLVVTGPARQHYRADGTPKVGCRRKVDAKQARRSLLAQGLPRPVIYRCRTCTRWHFATARA